MIIVVNLFIKFGGSMENQQLRLACCVLFSNEEKYFIYLFL